MYKKRLSGVVIPTITPMNEDGSIDERSLASFTEYLVQAGVDCLYPNGTNGESLLLSREEGEKARDIAARSRHVALGGNPMFNERYIENMMFESSDCD